LDAQDPGEEATSSHPGPPRRASPGGRCL
jgi:hypothetical protein